MAATTIGKKRTNLVLDLLLLLVDRVRLSLGTALGALLSGGGSCQRRVVEVATMPRRELG